MGRPKVTLICPAADFKIVNEMTDPIPEVHEDASAEVSVGGGAREWYPHWRERPDRTGRTHDWRDCDHCKHKSVYRGLGVRVCVFQAQPTDCNRYAYTFHPWLRADGQLWCWDSEPETYGADGIPAPPSPKQDVE